MATIEVRGLEKRFGNVTAVDGVNLLSKDGEFIVLLGPSGCGKTTLLRMIAGLEIPTHGEILIDEKVMTGFPPRARNIAMVFQSYALYPHMTVFKNIAFPLRPLGTKKEVIKKKVKWSAGMFGIEHLLNRKPRELSGGERQRVALARAMVREPSLFLLDEPLSNLDAKLRVSAREELKQLQKRIGITMLYVTHDQIEAMGLGERIVVMNEGKVRQIGSPNEVYRKPEDTFVATFLGSPPMNLIEKEDLLVGFRPESFLPLEVSSEKEEKEHFQFEVTWVEDLGSDRLVYGNVGIRSPHRHVIAKLARNITIHIEATKTYTFTVLRDEISFFDRKTGLRTDRKIPLGP